MGLIFEVPFDICLHNQPALLKPRVQHLFRLWLKYWVRVKPAAKVFVRTNNKGKRE